MDEIDLLAWRTYAASIIGRVAEATFGQWPERFDEIVKQAGICADKMLEEERKRRSASLPSHDFTQAKTSIMKLMIHADDCGEFIDSLGQCPRCKFHPDMQSLGFKEVSSSEIAEKRVQGATFMGLNRKPIS